MLLAEVMEAPLLWTKMLFEADELEPSAEAVDALGLLAEAVDALDWCAEALDALELIAEVVEELELFPEAADALELLAEAVDASEPFPEAVDALELLGEAVETLAPAALVVSAERATVMSSQSQTASSVWTQLSSTHLFFGSQVRLHMLKWSCFL